MLDLPFIFKFTEYNMVMVKIPANSGFILILVNRTEVNNPAKVPIQKAIKVLTMGFIPMDINLANKKAPKGKVPSTERSAIFSIL